MYNDSKIEVTLYYERNVSCRPKAKTVACHSCSNVVEVVITNSSPDTVMVDFKTSYTFMFTSNQPHCP